MQVRHDEEVRGGDVGTARCVRAAAGAAAAVVSNVDDGAMHAAREGGGTSIGDARVPTTKTTKLVHGQTPLFSISELRIL